MKTWTLSALLFLAAFCGASAQTFESAGLTLSGAETISLGGSLIVNGSTGGGTLSYGEGTLLISSDLTTGTLTGVLTIGPFTASGTDDSNPVLPVVLSGTGATLNMAIDPGTLSFDTTYTLDFSSGYIFDPNTAGAITLNLQAIPEPPTLLMLALSLMAGAGVMIWRSSRLRGSTRFA